MLISLLKKWVGTQCSPDKGKPLAGSQLTFAVRTVKAALGPKSPQREEADRSA